MKVAVWSIAVKQRGRRHRPTSITMSGVRTAGTVPSISTGDGRGPRPGGQLSAGGIVGATVLTVLGWLRRLTANAEEIRVLFTMLADDLDPLLAPIEPAGLALGDAVEAIAARAATQRLAPVEP